MANNKVIKVSADGVTYYTLPANTADINFDTEQLDDTTFGAGFTSSVPGLINSTMSSNAIFKGVAGYNTTVRRSGATPTATTGEAMSQVGTSQTYKIDDLTRDVWDYNSSVVVYDNAVPVAAVDIEEINYLFGEVTFDAGYTVTGPVTVDASYFSMTAFGRASEFTLTQTVDTEDVTVFENAQANGGFNVFDPTLKTADMDLSGFYSAANDVFAEIQARGTFVIEVDLIGDRKSIARGLYRIGSYGQSGGVADSESSDISLVLSVPVDVTPFSWYRADDSTMPQGFQVILDAWISGDNVYVQYLPDGEGNYGYETQYVVTDASITSGVNSLVEASASLQGTGTVTQIN